MRLYKLLFEAVLRSKVKYLMGKHTVPWYKKLVSSVTPELNYETVEKIVGDAQFQLLPQSEGSMSHWLDSFLEMVNYLFTKYSLE